MLVLSRKKGEAIVIDDRIVVTVIEIRGDKVRLGIEAPRDASVHRREVYEAIRQGQEREGAAPPPLRVTLSERHAALVERLRGAIRRSTGTDPGPERTVAAILDAAEEIEDHLEMLVLDALRSAPAP